MSTETIPPFCQKSEAIAATTMGGLDTALSILKTDIESFKNHVRGCAYCLFYLRRTMDEDTNGEGVPFDGFERDKRLDDVLN
jgi:hypothetical protein